MPLFKRAAPAYVADCEPLDFERTGNLGVKIAALPCPNIKPRQKNQLKSVYFLEHQTRISKAAQSVDSIIYIFFSC